MAWKQDLAKLKQQLGPEQPVAPKPPPRPAPPPGGPPPLADEDAVFLSAMGLKPAPPRPTPPAASEKAPEAPAAGKSPIPDSFQEAILELKGLKPMAKGFSARPISAPRSPLPTVPPPVPVEPVLPEPLIPVLVIPEPVVPVSEPQAPSVMPSRFQLAAGMAIEVDGSLDLRGHSLPDAMERLKDRLGDGLVLGWRSLQVTLGPDPILHEGLVDLLASGQVPMVARYAQAPVPMGGNQAWLLYFGPPPAQS